MITPQPALWPDRTAPVMEPSGELLKAKQDSVMLREQLALVENQASSSRLEFDHREE